ncbi:hypothetical protein CC2G_007776 [Coprinopsis cinerea AmutBmut pab1-1]|nr:hypothetical protein CC2G_007776 [Coprinopsis cinerea AmutBmut pab1-1]
MTSTEALADIVWSCLVTVFACTWLSVHPNVSGLDASWRQRIQQRIYLMLWGIAAPEFLVIFAYRQWAGARDISELVRRIVKEEKIERQSWTPAHSHFLQMGGFMFTDPSSPNSRAEFVDIHELATNNSADAGREALRVVLRNAPAVDEIWDRSKGDTLSKAVVAAQTAWFLAQIISRGVQHLTITELEVITLAYAAFNGAMYAFWWNKPLDVQCPIVIPSSGISRLRPYQRQSIFDTVTGLSIHWPHDRSGSDSSVFSLTSLPTSFQRGRGREGPDWNLGLTTHGHAIYSMSPNRPLQIADIARPSILSRWTLFFRTLLRRVIDYIHKPLDIMHRVYILTGFKRPRQNYPFTIFDQAHGTESKRQARQPSASDPSAVPMFYTYSSAPDHAPRSISISALAMFLASCFGAVHCIAWYFTRQTLAETLLWRISALLICLSPVVSCITFLVATWFSWLLYGSARWWHFLIVKKMLMKVLAPFHNHVFIPLLLPSYLIARLILIALAFAQLRKLPPTGHKTVEWSEFLPHV